jgi:GntR family transcriptional regulator/MocR family aminotransferase
VGRSVRHSPSRSCNQTNRWIVCGRRALRGDQDEPGRRWNGLLAIAIERDDERPIYRQIEDQIRSAIKDGRLPPDSRLPSVRDLSDQLAVAKITIANAYDDLVSEGYLTARVGSGTRVVHDLPDRALFAGGVPLRVLGAPPRPDDPSNSRIELRPAGLGLDLFPAERWGQLLQRSWREISHDGAISSDSTSGDPYLREAIANYVGVTRGVRAHPDDILVLSSVTAVCSLVATSFLGARGTGLVEDPGCPYFTRALSTTGARIVGIPVDDDGLIPDRLPVRADMLLVGPSWAYPLGGVMPMRRRRELITWANESGAVVVEHDWAGAVRFEGGPLPAIETLDSGGHVIFAGGFSEVIPPVRVGFGIIPANLRSRVEPSQSHLDIRPSPVDQRTLAHFIAEGHLETHLRRLRVALSARREQLAEMARSTLAEVGTVRMGAAGMQAILSLTMGFGRPTSRAGPGRCSWTSRPCPNTPWATPIKRALSSTIPRSASPTCVPASSYFGKPGMRR